MHKFSKIELVTNHLTKTLEDYLKLKMSCDGVYTHTTKKEDENYKIEVVIDPPSDVLETFKNIAHDIKDYLDAIDYKGKFEFKFIV
ncbi:hypothetical protein M2R48_08635 [Acinetobacter sp. I-MWF]|uniref:hypothetical protein n=1 Tax=Acinetobacter TaxID=469 RepID=UPI0021C8A1B3|nr:hypothetical protein [Acinetobacter sp. I-MWF]MCT9978388.1 hypothetical protein [Acinetobacter sp. I-MWF]